MRVVPFLLARGEFKYGFFFDEGTPLRVPRSERVGERFLVGLRERECQCSQLSASLGLRPSSQILRDLLDLVELADLYGNVFEYSQESASAVNNGSEEGPTPFFEDAASVPVVCHAFALNIVPPDVLLEVVRTKDADTVAVSPEGGVGNEDARLWREERFGNRDRVEVLSNPDMRTIVFLSELCECLFSVDVIDPQMAIIFCMSLLRLKLERTLNAPVSLQTAPSSIFLHAQ